VSGTRLPSAQPPIGVFDSGVGGLTVLRALRAALPRERFLYLGDTARLPYGTKSPETVTRYAVQAARILVERGVKALVVACNTASAVALEALQSRYAPLPVFGVVHPGAEAAAAASVSGSVMVLATESTVRGGAYQRALLRLRPSLRVLARPAPLLVTLAEEGRHGGPLLTLALEEYLRGLARRHGAPGADVLLLGCTHFPVFEPALGRVLADQGLGQVRVVDSAATTARAVAAELEAGRVPSTDATATADITLLATDGPERFRRVGRHFLGEPVEAVELVDL
jgi:glutamate racemase